MGEITQRMCFCIVVLLVGFALFLFLCSRWSFVNVPLSFSCPPDHVPHWQTRVLLGKVRKRNKEVAGM